MLETCRAELNPDLQLTWVPADFLEAQGVGEAGGLPLWVQEGTSFAGIWRANAERAAAQGLKARPLAESIRDIWAWWSELPEERRAKLKTGISLEKQAETLAAWHQSQAGESS